MQAASDLANTRTSGIVEQVFERLKHQARVTLARCRTKVFSSLSSKIVVELQFIILPESRISG